MIRRRSTGIPATRRIVRRVGRLGATVTLVATGACTAADDTTVADIPADSIDEADTAARVADPSASGVGVLAIGCGPSASAGSGVVLEAAGQVVTVAHTVAGATSVAVVAPDGTQWEARVIAFDPDADLAVLAVDGLTTTPLALGNVELGDAILVRWSVDDGVGERPVEVTQRLAITIDDIYGARQVRRTGIEIAGDVVVGDSGGPVISPNGDVIGIVYARSRSRAGTAFATDPDEIAQILATADPDDDSAVEPTTVGNGTCV